MEVNKNILCWQGTMKWALRIENNLVINLSVLKNVSTLLHKNSEVLIPPKFMELIQENNHK